MSRKPGARGALFGLLVAWCVLPLGAQEYRGRVQGFVTDPSNAAVTGADVTLTNQGTGIAVTRQTTENGMYLFDLVQPGTYTIAVRAAGFNAFEQKGIIVQTRGDVTVNASLQVGSMTETIEVTADATTVEFNNSSMSQTVIGKMLDQMPVIARNPFNLAVLNPAVVNRYNNAANSLPFYQISHAGMDIGGATGGRIQLLLDGTDTRVEQRGSYAPSMDAVQEVVVQQNPVDAEYGNSAGGAISIAMKSGTNELHGTGYYYGRNPYFNAVPSAITRTPNKARNHIGGGVVGGPVWIPKIFDGRNKAFFFVSYEKWDSSTVSGLSQMTLPTDLERQGDFSQSLNQFGNLRTIYDPMTTVLDPATNTARRTPFPGNRIPGSLIDPSAKALMSYVYQPNNPGEPFTHLNNWKASPRVGNPYNNLSVRGDYQFNTAWRAFGRYSRQNQTQIPEALESSPAYSSWSAARMYALNLAGNVDGMLSPTWLVNFRFGYIRSADELDIPIGKVDTDFWKSIWPNEWWRQSLSQSPVIYFPAFSVDGAAFGNASGWNLLPRQFNYSGTAMKQTTSHYLKFGAKLSHYTSNSGLPNWGTFAFTGATTASTYINPPTDVSGAGWASFLLGHVNSGYTNYAAPIWTISNNIGLFFQDDWKVSRNLTLNLGIRWEYDQAPREHDGNLGRYLDLSDPIPEFQTNPVTFPDLAKYGGFPARLTGAYQFLDSDNPRVFNAPKDVFLPRFGAAYRIDDKTSVRFGYSRYSIPFQTSLGPNWNLPNAGFSQRTDALAPLQGVPRTVLSDPFPVANPVLAPMAKSYGRYHQLGNAITYYNQYPKQPINNRINLSVQRELPRRIRLDVTFFTNLGQNLPNSTVWGNAVQGEQNNMMDPALSYQFKSELDTRVDNPFYNYLTPDKFPGSLRYQQTVSIGSLLKPYPQYGNLTEMYTPGINDLYRSLQIKVEKSYSSGLSFSFGYNYGRAKRDRYFNSDAQYARDYTMMDTLDFRHNLTAAPYWELPFGKGRRWATSLHPVLEAVVGGWTTSHLLSFRTGNLLSWGQLKVNGDPRVANPSRDRWFNTQAFAPSEPYTPRTNPLYYEGLTGPVFWNLDSTLAKNFQLTEGLRFELRMDAFNLPNHFLGGNPDMGVRSQTFGRALTQANFGREMQYTIRLHF